MYQEGICIASRTEIPGRNIPKRPSGDPDIQDIQGVQDIQDVPKTFKAYQVHRYRLQGTLVDHLELLRRGELAEMLVLGQRSPASGHLHMIDDRAYQVS